MRLVLIAAICERNGVIGKEGRLPWAIPEDLKRFRQLTKPHAVVMGRKTWETDLQRKPLSHRFNIVLSSQSLVEDGAVFVQSIEDAIARASEHEFLFVIGGASVYRQFFPLVEQLELTWVRGDFEGDTYFPFDKAIIEDFVLVNRQESEKAAFETYLRG